MPGRGRGDTRVGRKSGIELKKSTFKEKKFLVGELMTELGYL